MTKRCINAPDAPPARGPYSHIVTANGFAFLSGQGPWTHDGVVKGTLEEEARLTLENVGKMLKAVDCGFKDVVKVNVYLADMDDFPQFNEIYKGYFTENPPARTTIQAGRLPFDIKVEIECVALLPA